MGERHGGGRYTSAGRWTRFAGWRGEVPQLNLRPSNLSRTQVSPSPLHRGRRLKLKEPANIRPLERSRWLQQAAAERLIQR